MSRHVVVGPVLVVAMLFTNGCKKQSVDDAVKEWQSKVGAKLDAIEAIGKRPPSGQPSNRPKLKLVKTYPETTGDTILTYDDDLAALVKGSPPPTNSFRHSSSTGTVGCWYAVRNRKFGHFDLTGGSFYAFKESPIQALQFLPLCQDLAQASYIAVVHAAESSGGGVDLPESADKTASTFRRATGEGVIDVYELATGRDLGRRRYSAVGSSQVVYKTNTTGVASTNDAEQALGKDFMEHLHRGIEDSLAGDGPVGAPPADVPTPSPPTPIAPTPNRPVPAAAAAPSGKLAQSAIRGVVQKHVGALKACYDKRRSIDHAAAGTVTATFTIAASGSVSGASAHGIHPTVEACIAKQVATWKFPAPSGGAVNVSYPFAFGP